MRAASTAMAPGAPWPMLTISGNVQTPSLHAPPGSQAFAHAPQFMGSSVTVTHRPPQGSVPSPQTHSPASQLLPPMHCVPQEPQLSSSVFRSAQRELHTSQPSGHGSTYPAHTRGGGSGGGGFSSSKPQMFAQPTSASADPIVRRLTMSSPLPA